MSPFRMKYVLWRSFKFHILNIRYMSVLKTKFKKSYNFIPGNIALSSSRIGDIIDERADTCGDTIAVISDSQNVSKTYSEFRHEAERLASGLISIGLRKDDRVALYAPNCYEWPLTQFAAAKAGLILVNINPAFQSEELEYCLKKVDCKALITWDKLQTQNYYKLICDIIPDLPESTPGKLQSRRLPKLESIVMISEDCKNGTLNFNDVLCNGNKESDMMLTEIDKTLQCDDPANIQFTSGTTGAPKGVVLSHHNLVNNSRVAGPRFGFDIQRPTTCTQIPLFHTFGCVHACLTVINYQGTIVMPSPRFDAISSLKAIEKYKISVIYGTPTMYVDIIRHCQSGKFNISSLKQSILGGAASSNEILKNIKESLGTKEIAIGYGITETSASVASSCSEDDSEQSYEYLKPAINVEVKIVDSEGHLVPVNTQGEVCTRGYNTFQGYWNEEKKTAEVIDKARWYHTGDLAVMNDEGCIKIVGRIKDMIIRGGENIYPLEIENFLITHPSILEVHICGVPDKRFGEVACSWIWLKEGNQLTEEEVKEFCKGKISNYKIPQYVMFVKDFPKTASGKIKKFEMTKISIEKLKLINK